MLRIVFLLSVAALSVVSCQAQQQCAAVSPTNVVVPAGGGRSAEITITTTTPTGENNCGIYAPAYFELAFVSCINCNGTAAVSVSTTQLPDGDWQFVYYIENDSPNLSCAASTYEYVDGLGGTQVTATQESSCQGISSKGQGPAGTQTNPQGSAAEPVSTGNGNYYYAHTDLSFFDYNPFLPLLFQRSYNSLSTKSGPLGKGWTFNYNITVNPISTGIVGVEWGDGHSETYTLKNGSYVGSPGAANTLTGDPAKGNCTLTTKTGVQYSFSAGLLSNIQDRTGNTITIVRTANNSISQIVSGSGQQRLILNYESTTGRLGNITDNNGGGRVASYAYNGNGQLVSVTDPAGNETKYAYNSNGLLTSITLPNKSVLVQNTYDSSKRVISQINARGFTTTFAYNTPVQGQTTITDPFGNKMIHSYDSSMRIVGIIDGLGHTTSYTYDAGNNVTSVKDARGNTSHATYDSFGNIASHTDESGNKTVFTYNSFSEPLTITTPKGNKTVLDYDSSGNLTGLHDAVGNKSTFTYSNAGQLLSSTDARGNISTFSYSPDIPLAVTGVSDALGNQTTFGYDSLVGRLTSITDPNKNTSTIAYDPLNRVTSITDALGNQIEFGYDTVSSLTSVIDANGQTTAYAYDLVGDLIQVTDANGHLTKYAYDKNNNRVSFTNANGNVTKYAYDKANRLVKITDPLSYVISYELDPNSNVTAVTDANGKKNTYAYDADNRLSEASYSDGTSVKLAYDADSNRKSMVDSHGTTTYTYDNMDRVTSVGFPGSELVEYGYDPVGNRNILTYPYKSQLKFTYDADNRLSAVTDWKSRNTTYSYDPASNLIGIKFPNTATTALSYDSANRLTGIIDSSNSVAYRVLAYALDSAGNRTSVTDGALVTKYTYDSVNELLSSQTASGKITWTYDSVGNRTKQVAPSGTTNYTYDADNRMLTAEAKTFTYDNNGNRLGEDASSGNTTYTYDANNRLLSVAAPTASSSFAYDGDGNRVTQTTPTGTYDYVNDTAVRLPLVLNEKGPDGTIDYAYGLGLIEESSSAFDYFYNQDGLGSVSNLTNTAGKVVESYSYDAWGNAMIASGGVGTRNKFRFTGQALDPATALYFLRARYGDTTTGRFLSKDPFPGFAGVPLTSHRYIYAGNNPIRFVDPSGRLTGLDDGIFIVGGVISGLAGQLTSDWLNGERSSVWTYVGAAATGAATSWAVGTCIESVICAASAGALGGAGGSIVSNLLSGKSTSLCQIATAAFSGGVFSGASTGIQVPDSLVGNYFGGAGGATLDIGSQASAGCTTPPPDEGAPQSQSK